MEVRGQGIDRVCGFGYGKYIYSLSGGFDEGRAMNSTTHIV